jgi:hypothetical protein
MQSNFKHSTGGGNVDGAIDGQAQVPRVCAGTESVNGGSALMRFARGLVNLAISWTDRSALQSMSAPIRRMAYSPRKSAVQFITV